MADYFTNLSLVLNLPDAAAQAYALELANQASAARQGAELPADFPKPLTDVIEDWNFETEPSAHETPHGLWFHSDCGGVDALCTFLQHLLQRFDPGGLVTFEWSHDCSKPRTDAYGGGAAFVTAKEIKTFNTGEWLREQTANHKRTSNMEDRCYMELLCRREDQARFEAMGFTPRDGAAHSRKSATITMVDEQANNAHSGQLPTDIPYLGIHGAGGDYGSGAFACDGRRLAEVETGYWGGFVVDWDEARPQPLSRGLRAIRRYLHVRKTVLRRFEAMPSPTAKIQIRANHALT